MGKRANGEGSIYKTKDRKTADGKTIPGRWVGSITVGMATGKQIRRYRTAATRSSVIAKLDKLRDELKLGLPGKMSSETFGAFVVNSWLEHVKAHRSPNTESLYRTAATLYVVPRLGGFQMPKINSGIMQDFVDKMITDGVKPRMRQVCFAVARKALRYAMKLNKIGADPTTVIEKPTHEPEEIFPFDAAQAATIIKETKGDRWHALYVLSLTCGMRIGELLGLPWAGVDFQERQIRVTQQASQTRGTVSIRKPKTKSSIRTIDLPQIAYQALRDHQAIMLKEGKAGCDLVFPSPEGGTMQRTNFATRAWKPLIERLKFDARGFHHTRHTYATLALMAGVSPLVVAKVMGHSKPSTTLNTYGHVLKGQQSQSTDAIGRIFGVAVE